MPHFTIEYSAELDDHPDVVMTDVVELVRQAAVETGIFPLGGIRVRAIPCRHVAMADGRKGLLFLAMVLRMGEGRDLDTRKVATGHIFAALQRYFKVLLATNTFALSFDTQINEAATSWKANTIHDLF